MKCHYGLPLFVILSCEACATSLGWNGEPRVKVVDNAPAICLPDDVKEDFPVRRVLLSESYVKNSIDWELRLAPGAIPLSLKPGECIKFGRIPIGYLLDETSKLKALRVNATYSFMMDRVEDAEHYNHFYSTAFCVKKGEEGDLEYPQYTRLPNGSTVIPSCDARLNKNAE